PISLFPATIHEERTHASTIQIHANQPLRHQHGSLHRCRPRPPHHLHDHRSHPPVRHRSRRPQNAHGKGNHPTASRCHHGQTAAHLPRQRARQHSPARRQNQKTVQA